MATFRTLAPEPPPVQPGTYLVRVIAAKDRVSSNNNDMIVMRLALPDGSELPCTITFTESARKLINAFCASAELVIPDSPDIEIELTATQILHRWLYVTVGIDPHDDDALPRVVRFLTRSQAILRNPALEQTVVNQVPIRLPGKRTGGQTC